MNKKIMNKKERKKEKKGYKHDDDDVKENEREPKKEIKLNDLAREYSDPMEFREDYHCPTVILCANHSKKGY